MDLIAIRTPRNLTRCLTSEMSHHGREGSGGASAPRAQEKEVHLAWPTLVCIISVLTEVGLGVTVKDDVLGLETQVC